MHKPIGPTTLVINGKPVECEIISWQACEFGAPNSWEIAIPVVKFTYEVNADHLCREQLEFCPDCARADMAAAAVKVGEP